VATAVVSHLGDMGEGLIGRGGRRRGAYRFVAIIRCDVAYRPCQCDHLEEEEGLRGGGEQGTYRVEAMTTTTTSLSMEAVDVL
jgi:hypothetical protein